MNNRSQQRTMVIVAYLSTVTLVGQTLQINEELYLIALAIDVSPHIILIQTKIVRYYSSFRSSLILDDVNKMQLNGN